MLIIVVIKLIAPKIEDTPAKWSEKIVRSTDAPACAKFPASGGRLFNQFQLPLRL